MSSTAPPIAIERPRASSTFGARARTAGLLFSVIFSLAFVDGPVTLWVHRHCFSNETKSLLRFVRLPGHFVFTLALVALLLWRCRWTLRQAMILIVVSIVASGITATLKLLVGRLRPFRGTGVYDWHPMSVDLHLILSGRNLSFPSGDATLAFATAAIVAHFRNAWRSLAMGWAIAVGVTRVLQGAHYPSDVIGGAIVGLLTAEVVLRFNKASDPLITPLT